MAQPYPTLNSFLDLMYKYGISSSNIYDVNFLTLENISHPLFQSLKQNYTNDNADYTPGRWLRFYTDELSIPGEQVQTSEYKINNSPAYSYATDVVYPEINITFLLDAYMNQKKIFDKWVEYIKPMNEKTIGTRFRVKYRDEYVSDIKIIKYERWGNGYSNADKKELVPIKPSGSMSVQPVARYSTVLHNAYPTAISSIQLNSGSSQINRVSVSFKYEYPTYSSTSEDNIGFETIDVSKLKNFGA